MKTGSNSAKAIRTSPVRTNPPGAPEFRDPVKVQPERAKGAQHFDELEAYRGVAALLIVVFHVYQYSRQATHQSKYLYEGTWLHHILANQEAGVAWFFALSGFLLFLPIARNCIYRLPRQSARSFLVRRAIRILPLYYFAILVVWAWRYAGLPGQWRDLFNHLTFTQTFDDQHLFWTIGPAWSLAVEVHFYIALAAIAPLLYLLCGRLPWVWSRTTLLLLVVAGIWGAGIGYNWWVEYVAHIPHARPSMYFSLPAKLDNFATGMLLAVVTAAANGRIRISWPLAWVLRIGGFAAIIWALSLREYSSLQVQIRPIDTYFHSVSALAFTAIMASTVLGPRRSPWTRVLARPSLQTLGLLSYSIYMWHEPILIELGQREYLIKTNPDAFWQNVVILVALSSAIALVTYRCIERPTMDLRYLFDPSGRLATRYLPLPSSQSRADPSTTATVTGSD